MIGINEFIKAVSVAEVEYGKALQKAAKPFRDEIKKMLEKQEKSPIPLQKAITSRYPFVDEARLFKHGTNCLLEQNY
jgi:hypothetical protein